MCPQSNVLGALGLFLIVAGAQAQRSGEQPRDDVTTLDGIIRAYYEIVSGPAGEAADRARDEYIHFPGALVAITSVDATGTPTIQTMSIGEYHDRLGGPRQNPFYEWEIHRVTELGNEVHPGHEKGEIAPGCISQEREDRLQETELRSASGHHRDL